MESYCITDVGRIRSVNQDYVFASDTPVGRLPNLFVVADGMGGHNAGDRASSYAVEVFLRNVRWERDKNPIRIIRRSIEKANTKVLEEANSREKYQGMGTTMVVATIVKDILYVANVGDSRLYLIGGKSIRQITRDHSLVEEMIRAGGLTREEGRYHPDKNVITRAIGVEERVAIDFFDVQVSKNDTLLLCTDGLSNMLTDEEMKRIITEESSLRIAGKRLVEAANKNGGSDNITALLVRPRGNEVKKC
ncbi:protein phosphatase 2C [Marvinbryantia formatexigens DSM 14469]|uniref:Protein phosphatase 2C n=1 Tax=Marvinbryantia formatexigens DSM 14469 TaxID=478749 RepID=C6LGY8_9FIRM|nr:Stp1/IreP family PP2C-type Ser/Thr phosphatase [Marvinbryantia formatexigens]EET60047.1 protein phosphatase 2C [Marvinbryantia formatexigens DSM 14469]UWO23845.1 Stp1/IreP family PP2C-type Ser/Thr phosphatase [Marvinbryantia formatexigens DSM 14469]SDG50170.1 protein phosphatase [Marvinbryantia formatexigens]